MQRPLDVDAPTSKLNLNLFPLVTAFVRTDLQVLQPYPTLLPHNQQLLQLSSFAFLKLRALLPNRQSRPATRQCFQHLCSVRHLSNTFCEQYR